jgi:integrase
VITREQEMNHEQRKLEHLSPKDFSTLLRRLQRYPLHRTLLLLIYSFGLSIQELSKIALNDINLDKKFIFISNLKTKGRYLPLTNFVIQELKAIAKDKTSGFLFYDSTSSFCYSTVHRLLKEIQFMTGVNINTRRQKLFIFQNLLCKGWKTNCIANFLGYSETRIAKILPSKFIKD